MFSKTNDLVHFVFALILFFSLCLTLLFKINASTQFAAIFFLTSLLMIVSRDVLGAVTKNYTALPLKLLLLFFVWVILSVLWSQDIDLSLRYVQNLYFLILAVPYGLILFRGGVGLFVVLQGALSLLLFITVLYQSSTWGVERAPGFFYDPNAAATFYLISAAFAISAYLFAQPRYRPIIGLLMVLVVCAIGMTQSRAGLLALFVMFALSTISSWHTRDTRRRLFHLVLYAAFGLILENALASGSYSRLVDTLHTIDSQNIRLSLWATAYELFLDSPYTGSGIGVLHGSYVSHLPEGVTPHLLPHNDYLQLLAELGPVGLGLFLAHVVTLLVLFRPYAGEALKEVSWSHHGAWLALTATYVMIFFNYYFYNPTFTLLLGFCTGVVIAAGINTRSSVSGTTSWGYVALSIMVFCTILYISYAGSNYFMHRASIPGQDHSETMDGYQMASIFSPYRPEPLMGMGNTLAAHAGQQNGLTSNQQQAILNYADQFFVLAKQRARYNHEVHLAHAQMMGAYPSLFSSQKVRDSYDEALRIRPNYLHHYLLYSDYLFSIGDGTGALRVLVRAGGMWFEGGDWKRVPTYCSSFSALNQKYVLGDYADKTDQVVKFCRDYQSMDQRFGLRIRGGD